ncbi:50S ribosomal protein L7/L12 [Arcanobacterium pinnipediorum]|uniref:50S ribosomal protein L7/L12 n=1 Tax=Arcanobacterium pinnipediorum TaxID=1503041 RepID=A0ABY5AI33_9ACTO|nr:50S ribosomal protein L7/L12 [Arcanobacterium pinnipediorum]USR79865.1 50S ribosomal protein L7/L12 [Arcanobacterium pinnipediorum]
MGKWFDQAREIERLRRENQRLLILVAQLKERLGDEASNVDVFGVSAEERQLATSGRKVEAIKAYRERTGADLVTAKNAIDSVG